MYTNLLFSIKKRKKLYRRIGNLLNISKNIVADIIRRYIHEDRIECIPQKRHSKFLTVCDKHKIIKKIKKILD